MDSRFESFVLAHASDAGETRAVVVPVWGANVIGMSYQAAEWAWPLPVLEAVDVASIAARPTSYGVPILAPTPGRVGRGQSGRLRFRGRTYQMSPSRHGLLRQLSWEVVHRSESALRCTAQVEPRRGAADPPSFPFHFRARYDVAVSQAALLLTLELRNTGDEVQPLDAGWHPYLSSKGSRTISIPAAERWELDDQREPTPTGRVAAVSGRDDFRDGRVVAPDEHWDDVFSLPSTPTGHARSWLEETDTVHLTSGETVRCRIRRWVEVPVQAGSEGEAPLPYMQLYTPPFRSATSLEPLSAVPNAINLVDEGCLRAAVNLVSPGERVTYRMRIGLERRPA